MRFNSLQPQSFWRVSGFLLHYPPPQRSASRLSLQILCYQCNRNPVGVRGPERRQEDSGTSKDVSWPGIEPGSQEIASCAITARPPQHDTTGPPHRSSFWRVSGFLLQSGELAPPKRSFQWFFNFFFWICNATKNRTKWCAAMTSNRYSWSIFKIHVESSAGHGHKLFSTYQPDALLQEKHCLGVWFSWRTSAQKVEHLCARVLLKRSRVRWIYGICAVCGSLNNCNFVECWTFIRCSLPCSSM